MEKLQQLNTSIKSPMRLFTWMVGFPAVAGIEGGVPNIRAQSTSLPSLRITQIELWNWGLKAKYAGQVQFDNAIDFTIADDEDLNIHTWMLEWMKLSINLETGLVQPKPDYVKDFPIHLMNVQNESILRTFLMAQAWPASVGPVALEKSRNADSMKFTVTFVYDYYTIKS